MSKEITNEDLESEVLKLIKQLGRVPTLKEYDIAYRHRGMINSRFGTWNKFLYSIGVEPVQRHYEDESCKVNGCKNKAQSKGLCRRHYDQILKSQKIYDRTRFDFNEIIQDDDYAEIIVYSGEDIIKGKVMIDIEDIKKIENYKVYVDSEGYATVTINQNKIHLVEFLLGKLEGDECYSYKNKNTLDCRKQNVYIATMSEILRNQKIQKRNKTGVKGIFKNEKTGKFQVSIGNKGKKHYIGSFDTLEEAKQARRLAEKHHWGKIYTED